MKPKAIIMDLDGCLCDTSSIVYLVDKTHENFTGKRLDEFHLRSMECPPRVDMSTAWFQAKHDGVKVIVLTGRPEKWRQETHWWLVRNAFSADQHLHRQPGDKRPAHVFKQEVLKGLQETYDIVHAYDDDPRVVAMYERNNVPRTLIPGWPVIDNEPVQPADFPEAGEPELVAS